MATVVGTAAPTATAAASATAAERAACVWTPAILPLPTGALTGDVVATDGSGGYAGTISYGADSEEGGRAVLWKNGKFTDYGNLADPEYQNWITVDGVNDAGTVVGAAYRQDDGLPTALRSRNGKMERLPELPGADASVAEGINDHGDIVGAVEATVDGEWYYHPVIWPADKPGTVVKLTGLPDGEAFATGIDQDGTVLVEVDNGFGRVPYLWKDGEARPLSLPDGAYDVIARGISNGRVIGQVSYDSMESRSVLWDRDGKPRVMARGDDVQGINRDGQIVGRTDDPSWREHGVWQLTTLGSTLSYGPNRGLELAVSSDDGTIAGRSWTFPGGRDEPTVWTCR
ncbi:hypothetical protein G5C60_07900 [Streptomyces sp. HC44]|uniref:Uncharacterized protein n=1 Tax=Streptomyces scabichelini TaxID=2711217 RepID=A0A6G4V0Q7_9ACTN|nr:hypothetical protein [Streptomyces scabichelini]NGO07576.1 hypothetical protein [Streptomyces scabichelini]